jgi:hypothetical protein
MKLTQIKLMKKDAIIRNDFREIRRLEKIMHMNRHNFKMQTPKRL